MPGAQKPRPAQWRPSPRGADQMAFFPRSAARTSRYSVTSRQRERGGFVPLALGHARARPWRLASPECRSLIAAASRHVARATTTPQYTWRSSARSLRQGRTKITAPGRGRAVGLARHDEAFELGGSAQDWTSQVARLSPSRLSERGRAPSHSRALIRARHPE
jgi:hypothetical protein